MSSHCLDFFLFGWFLMKCFKAVMNKLNLSSNVTQGRLTKLTCDTQLGESFHMGNGITKLQDSGEPTKSQDKMKVSNTMFSVPFSHPVQRGSRSKQAMCSSYGSNPCQSPYTQQCMSRHCFWGPVLNIMCLYCKKTPRTCALQLYILFLNCDFITEISIISKIFAGSSPVTRYSTKRQQC